MLRANFKILSQSPCHRSELVFALRKLILVVYRSCDQVSFPKPLLRIFKTYSSFRHRCFSFCKAWLANVDVFPVSFEWYQRMNCDHVGSQTSEYHPN